MSMKKKKINEGIRSIAKNLVKEKEVEENLKIELAKEFQNKKSK